MSSVPFFLLFIHTAESRKEKKFRTMIEKGETNGESKSVYKPSAHGVTRKKKRITKQDRVERRGSNSIGNGRI